MLHTITTRLEICIDINVEISEIDHYTRVFTSRIFSFALEITFLLNEYFSHTWLTSYFHKVENLIRRLFGTQEYSTKISRYFNKKGN